jgi:hypothetical protein
VWSGEAPPPGHGQQAEAHVGDVVLQAAGPPGEGDEHFRDHAVRVLAVLGEQAGELVHGGAVAVEELLERRS